MSPEKAMQTFFFCQVPEPTTVVREPSETHTNNKDDKDPHHDTKHQQRQPNGDTDDKNSEDWEWSTLRGLERYLFPTALREGRRHQTIQSVLELQRVITNEMRHQEQEQQEEQQQSRLSTTTRPTNRDSCCIKTTTTRMMVLIQRSIVDKTSAIKQHRNPKRLVVRMTMVRYGPRLDWNKPCVINRVGPVVPHNGWHDCWPRAMPPLWELDGVDPRQVPPPPHSQCRPRRPQQRRVVRVRRRRLPSMPRALRYYPHLLPSWCPNKAVVTRVRIMMRMMIIMTGTKSCFCTMHRGARIQRESVPWGEAGIYCIITQRGWVPAGLSSSSSLSMGTYP